MAAGVAGQVREVSSALGHVEEIGKHGGEAAECRLVRRALSGGHLQVGICRFNLLSGNARLVVERIELSGRRAGLQLRELGSRQLLALNLKRGAIEVHLVATAIDTSKVARLTTFHADGVNCTRPSSHLATYRGSVCPLAGAPPPVRAMPECAATSPAGRERTNVSFVSSSVPNGRQIFRLTSLAATSASVAAHCRSRHGGLYAMRQITL